jgi:hypothetical protein
MMWREMMMMMMMKRGLWSCLPNCCLLPPLLTLSSINFPNKSLVRRCNRKRVIYEPKCIYWNFYCGFVFLIANAFYCNTLHETVKLELKLWDLAVDLVRQKCNYASQDNLWTVEYLMRYRQIDGLSFPCYAFLGFWILTVASKKIRERKKKTMNRYDNFRFYSE